MAANQYDRFPCSRYSPSQPLLRRLSLLILLACCPLQPASATNHRFSVSGDQVLFDGHPFKVVGLRCSNALMSVATTRQLIANLDAYKAHGVNTISVFLMGSRFGDVKGYRPDATLDPAHAARLGQIIEAADARAMIVLVGCLYWSDSKAREDLKHWKQPEAEQAIVNTIAWLKAHDYRNVFVDVDNEGMAHRAAGFDIERLIKAAHQVDPTIMVAWNDKSEPSPNVDLLVHHSPRQKGKPWIQSEGTPNNAPGGYWGAYSKRPGLYNYINIGVYTDDMKADTIRQTERDVAQSNGFILASTWLQCVPPHGPNHVPGGQGTRSDPGVQWWLDHTRQKYGPGPVRP